MELEYLKTPNFSIPQMKFSLAVNQRKILLYDEINEDSITEVVYYLNKIRDMDKKLNRGKDPIEIQINTNGGFVSDGLTLVSLIENMKSEGYKIITTNIGRAYSMGFILAICGSERRAYKYSHYMYHDLSYGAYGKHNDVVDAMECAEYFKEVIKDIILKYTALTPEEIEEYNSMRKDKFFTPTEVLEFEGVDYIV